MEITSRFILFFSVLIGGIFSIFACAFPDGLERVAQDSGFVGFEYNIVSGLIPDYAMPGINYEPLAVSLAGIAGTVLTFGLIITLGQLLIRIRIGK